MATDTSAPSDLPAAEAPTAPPTAAVLLIGNELLSGRTKDINLAHIAESLVGRGIRLLEARIIADIPQAIVTALNELRANHDYVFTTGGIGPTHDDITADCVAEAFGVDLPINPEARAVLQAFCDEREIELNEDRLRMARIPTGASLIDNPVSAAPGFRMDNVFVMAGVPRIMQAMLASILPDLRTGPIMHSISVGCDLGEGTVASALRALQEAHPAVEIGSYPGKTGQLGRLSLVARGTDEAELDVVRQALTEMVSALGGQLS